MDITERDLGEQPIAKIIKELNIKPHDLVEASTEMITHKMVSRAVKGRRLTPKIQNKILNALNNAAGRTFKINEIFNY